VDLFVSDPTAADQIPLLEKKGLLYPIRLRVVLGFGGGGSPSSPPMEPEQGRHRRRHKRRHRSSPPHPSLECEPSTRPPVHARLGPTTSHVEVAHYPSACGVPLAFDAVLPKAATASVLPASPVPQTAVAELWSGILVDRYGARDEEDPPKSFVEIGTLASFPALSTMEEHLSGLNGPSLGRLSLGPDRSQKLTGPDTNDQTSLHASFPCAADSFERSPAQELPEGMGNGLAGPAASTVPSPSECARDCQRSASPFAHVEALEVPSG
jgi:hypothetical protein